MSYKIGGEYTADILGQEVSVKILKVRNGWLGKKYLVTYQNIFIGDDGKILYEKNSLKWIKESKLI